MIYLEYTPPLLHNDLSRKDITGGNRSMQIQRFHTDGKYKMLSKLLPTLIYNYNIYEDDELVYQTFQTVVLLGRVQHKIVNKNTGDKYLLKDKSTSKFTQKAEVYDMEENFIFTLKNKNKERSLMIFDIQENKLAEWYQLQPFKIDLSIDIYNVQYDSLLLLSILNAYDRVY